MGRGDKKSKKGKRWKGSFGVSRRRNSIKARLKRSISKKAPAVMPNEAAEAVAAPKAKRTTKKKTEA